MASCGTGAPDALDCRAEKGEGQGASQPGHGAAVRLILLGGNHRGKPLIANGGSISHASCCRHNKGSKGAVFNLTDALFISPLFCVLMLPVACGDGLTIGGSMGVEDPDVEKGAFMTASPETTCSHI